MSLYDDYRKQFTEFARINDMNLEERIMRVPAEKHFWVEQLIAAKRNRFKLLKERKIQKDLNIKKAIAEGVVNLTKQTLDKLDNTKDIEDIDEKIQDIELLIEYLELVVKHITFIAQDIKNILTIKEMQM